MCVFFSFSFLVCPSFSIKNGYGAADEPLS